MQLELQRDAVGVAAKMYEVGHHMSPGEIVCSWSMQLERKCMKLGITVEVLQLQTCVRGFEVFIRTYGDPSPG